jgi:N-succinyldiaminopimelate aminotransferase
MTGLPVLHAAIAAKYERDYGLAYRVDEEITVTSGCTEAIFAAINALCDVGDEVVVFEPFYDSYRASVFMAGAIPRVVTLRYPDWSFDAAALRRAFSARTRAVLLNSPHNPTGKVFTPAELATIAALCVEFDVVCVSDEVYEHLVYEGVHTPIATLPGMRERTITLSSLGKTFSLTGWKIGWACAPPPLSAAVRAAHQFLTFATATPLQVGAASALTAPRSYYDELLASYRWKRDYLAGELTRIGFDVRPSEGTYFLCAGFGRFSADDDVTFCRRLIASGVAVIPPSVFYENPEHGRAYVRFAFCKREETLRAAVARLDRLGAS